MSVLLFQILFIVSLNALASSQTFQNKPTIDFNIDYAGFRHEDEQIELEVYYAFQRNQLVFVEQDSLKVAAFQVEAKIYQGDSLYVMRNWIGRAVIGSEQQQKQNQRLFTLSRFVLPAGRYRYETRVRDTNSSAEGVYRLDVNLAGFPAGKLCMSDIELATSVAQDTSTNIFTKNNYLIIPQPGALFTVQNPMLYFYAEIYNLHPGGGNVYELEYAIMDDAGSQLRSYPPKRRKYTAASAVEVGGVNVIALPTGTYFLQLKLKDVDSGIEFVRQKKFYTFRGGIASDRSSGQKTDVYQLSFLLEEYQSKSLEQIDEEFYSADYLATKVEKEIYASLDLEGKRKFMPEFWSKTDMETEKSRMEIKAVHEHRLNYVREHFEGIKKGWQTDRGRVVMKYGEPDNIEKNFSLRGRRGYEVWRYYSQEGGLIFVFVDKGRFGDLELVHSNARAEINDPEWQRWIEQ
ncbi:MAG: GWxTD domain-containing protein [bacterium]